MHLVAASRVPRYCVSIVMNQQSLFGADEAPDAKPSKPLFSWFFALRPSPLEAQRVYEEAGQLLTARGVSGRRIDAARLHITLEFLGDDVGDEVLQRACAAADAVTFPGFALHFDALMTFPIGSAPLVLVGSAGLDDVRKLHADLATALRDRGFKPKRSFEPHLTLCYDPRHRLARTAVDAIGFEARKIHLVKSHLGKSLHEVVRSWPLKG